ncbi:MAG: DegT/DnrJ/EryC1/StrS family aminotransferase [Anaerolineae bacterium]|nr:DegT/DnrJ/EryC1/StrS family aminotransferase [Anaerolineae bacterium]
MIPISKPLIGDAEKNAVMEVLDSGMLAQGPRTALFEDRFAATCGTKHAIATSCGTTALHIALLAHDIGKGDEVITTPFTFQASINSILFVGAKPIFVDIEEETFNINPDLIESAITPRVKAIMPVHLYGHMCNMDAIIDIAQRHDLFVIEDAAQAIGAAFNSRCAGSFGSGCFSLYATKNVMSGEGGMITTDDEAVAQRCKMLRNHGMQRRYYHEMLGYNFRMTDLHAAIGLVQMERLEEFTARRQANAAYLNSEIRNLITPKVHSGYKHVWHQYTVRMPGKPKDGLARDAAVKQLNEAGVGTGIFYPIPAHKHGYLRDYGVEAVSLPVTEQVANEVFSLPVHPQLSQEDLETIVTEVNRL